MYISIEAIDADNGQDRTWYCKNVWAPPIPGLLNLMFASLRYFARRKFPRFSYEMRFRLTRVRIS